MALTLAKVMNDSICTPEGMQVSLNLLDSFALGDSFVLNFLIVGQGDICANYDDTFVLGFPGGSDGKESSCNVGDLGLIPGSERFPRGGNGYPFQYP